MEGYGTAEEDGGIRDSRGGWRGRGTAGKEDGGIWNSRGGGWRDRGTAGEEDGGIWNSRGGGWRDRGTAGEEGGQTWQQKEQHPIETFKSKSGKGCEQVGVQTNIFQSMLCLLWLCQHKQLKISLSP